MRAKRPYDIGDKAPNDPWLPMIVIALTILMSFHISAVPVSMSSVVNSINTPPTTEGTAVRCIRSASRTSSRWVPS
jgi:hypothetical protein